MIENRNIPDKGMESEPKAQEQAKVGTQLLLLTALALRECRQMVESMERESVRNAEAS